MKWSEIPFDPSPRVLRQFAGAWLVFFGALSLYHGLARGHPRLGLALGAASVVVGALGLLRPAAVRWLFVGWMIVAFPVGWMISQVMLILLFYGMLTPVALFFRLRGRDLLHRKPASDQATFWTDKETPRDVRRYFRQY
jgi:hypothetical protein